MLSSFTEIGMHHYLFISLCLFVMGMMGILLRKNIIVILMSIELMLNGVNLAFITFGHFNNDGGAAVMTLFIMAIAAAEAAVGLAIAVTLFKNFKEINIRFFEHLKG